MCGGGIGSAIGGLAGSFFGPAGSAIGSAVGGLLGGGKKPSTSTNNAAAEQRKAEVDAINKANAQTAMKRKALRDNSLFTGAGETGAGTGTLGVGG